MFHGSAPTNTPESLSIAEVARDYLNCSEDSVRRMIARGDLRAYRVGKRLIRIHRSDLERALKPVTRLDLVSAGGDAR